MINLIYDENQFLYDTENYIPVKLLEATPNEIIKVKLTKENINYNLED